MPLVSSLNVTPGTGALTPGRTTAPTPTQGASTAATSGNTATTAAASDAAPGNSGSSAGITSVTSSTTALTVATGTNSIILTFNPANVPLSALAGDVALSQLPATGTAGQVLSMVGGAVAWATPAAGSGTVTDVTSTSNAITVATGTSTPALTFNPANVTLASLGGTLGASQVAAGTNGQVLTTNSSGQVVWSSSIASTLASDTDVGIASPSDGQFFVYSGNNSKWVNTSTIAVTPANTTGPGAGGNSYYASNFSTANYVRYPAASGLTFGTGDWTIEGWIYPEATNTQNMFDMRGGNAGEYLVVTINGGALQLYVNGGYVSGSSGTVTLNAWQHFAYVRHSNTTHLYINGTSVNSFQDLNNYITASTNSLGVGGDDTLPYSGEISNFRITNNAVYTANFTTPTGQLTAIPGTQLLTCQNSTFVDNSPNHATITVTGSPTLTAIQGVQFGNGNGQAVTISCPVVATEVETGSGAASWIAGTGAPTYTAPAGSLYSQTDGATGTRLYVSAGGGTWNAVAGV